MINNTLLLLLMYYEHTKTRKSKYLSSDHFCLVKVAGVRGLIIANKKEDAQMRTYITYNKGQTWSLLQPPSKDTTGHDINCNLVRATGMNSTRYIFTTNHEDIAKTA